MLVPLVDAVPPTCGGKAGLLGALLREGFPVPDGFVIPFAAYRGVVSDLDLRSLAGGPGGPDAARAAIATHPLPDVLHAEVARALEELGDVPVAVRSSAAHEDTACTSAAGQHESVLAVRGADEVVDAVRACWASLFSPGAVAYRDSPALGPRAEVPVMAVLVQRHLDADVSGVMFTPDAPDGVTEIEAAWGLGPSVVAGVVTPDAYCVGADGRVVRTVADKRTRLDRHGTQLLTSDVPALERERPVLGDAEAADLATLGHRLTALLGCAQDVEWALVDGRTWVLQARPVTAALPLRGSRSSARDVTGTLTGTPGSAGRATGPARVVRGPADFSGVRRGDILVCPWTDPGWTPLLRVVGGVVTETGGVLSHAAIVAREHRIPAVLGVANATTRLRDAATITIDGTAGTITAHA